MEYQKRWYSESGYNKENALWHETIFPWKFARAAEAKSKGRKTVCGKCREEKKRSTEKVRDVKLQNEIPN